jgi:hypothetical protein
MLTTPWITRAQIAQYKQISKSVYDDKLNQIILESQFNDIMPLMGERFYNDFNNWLILYLSNQSATHPNNEAYTKLFNGGLYEYLDTTYTNYGMISVLSNYVYARYAMFGDIIDNPFGMVNKLQGNESVPISMSAKQTLYKMNQDIAFNYWQNVRKFIIRNTTDFPLFQTCFVSDKSKSKISKIGSNNDYNKFRR